MNRRPPLPNARERRVVPLLEELESREVPAATAALVGNTLSVGGTGGDDRIAVLLDRGTLLVMDGTAVLGRFDPAAVAAIGIDAGNGNNVVKVAPNVTQTVSIAGGSGANTFVGGGGTTSFVGGAGRNVFFGGNGANTFVGDGGATQIYKAMPNDIVFPGPNIRVLRETLPQDPTGALGAPQQTLTATDVGTLLDRASAASASRDAIIAVTDRNGSILGVRVEGGVDPAITGNDTNLVFAIDGAYAEALTGAYFGNNQAPLTSRTVQFISQSTITQREVESNPDIADPNGTLAGPGLVAAVAINAHFPPGIALTPQVDLFQIEHTNRDGPFSPGADGVVGTADDLARPNRFNIQDFAPGEALAVPASYGDQSGLRPHSQSRGIGTLPGGIPIVKNGQVVGGIGVFFPGKTGFATEENSSLGFTYDPTKPDRSLEAEWMAFAAVGGYSAQNPIGTINGVALPDGISGLPFGRIDLVGITLPLVGPGNPLEGLQAVLREGVAVGIGNPFDGVDEPVGPGVALKAGAAVPEGWIVAPHDGVGISKEEVQQIIVQGIEQANLTRAAIRLPASSKTRMVFAVSDRNGTVVGLYRMPDATVFSIDVAVAKARNVNYYADPTLLQPQDRVPGVPLGTALTNRTFRYLGQPRFPEGIDGAPPGPFSQLNDGGADRFTALQVGPRLPASAYQSVIGYDSFHPGTNFRDPANPLNQNGIVFFPGSAPLYRNGALIGGFGVSGDGVDQDDVVTSGGQTGFEVPTTVLRADQVFVRGVRLPYQKFDRNPDG